MDLQIIKIASNNKNQKDIKNFTHKIKNKNSICGDEIIISLLIKKNIIKDIGYNCKSCVFCQASINLLSKKVTKMDIVSTINLCNNVIDSYQIKEGKFDKKINFFKKILTKDNFARKDCLLLPFITLRKLLTLNDRKN